MAISRMNHVSGVIREDETTGSETYDASVAEAIERWIDGERERERAEVTRSNYRRALRSWITFLVKREEELGRASEVPAQTLLWSVDVTDVRGWQDSLRERGNQPATINHMLAAVSSFYEFALSTHIAPPKFKKNPLRASVVREAVEPYATVRVLTSAEYDQVLHYLEAHSDSLRGIRAHALIRTLLQTGWRGRELLAMRAGDLSPARNVPGALRYHCITQSHREFVDVLPADCTDVLLAYLEKDGRPLHTLPPQAYIWTAVQEVDLAGFNTKFNPAKPISVKQVLRVVRTHLEDAGIADADKIRLHDLRHTLASLLWEGGATKASISKRLRHAHIESTDRYLRKLFGDEPVDEQSAILAQIRKRAASGKSP